MSKSTHQIAIKGVDNTAGAFSSISSRAKVTGAQIRSMVGGALAASAAYLSFRSVKAGVDELGHLSDIAQKTSTSVDELTRTTTALSALGIQNMGVDQIAKSFDYLAKTTGRSGMNGFLQTIEELGKIEDVSKRSQEAIKVFGRSGMEFMPLINAADTSVDALRTVIAAMPAVPEAAAQSGDAVSDAMGFAANQVKSIWLQGLGTICGWLDNEYTGGVREAALTAGNYLELFTKAAVARCITLYHKLVDGAIGVAKMFASWGTFARELWNGNGFRSAWEAMGAETLDAMEEYNAKAEHWEKLEEERTDRFARTFADRAIAIQKFQGAYDKAAISLQGRRNRAGSGFTIDGFTSPRISNDLVIGGSNAATKLHLLGPTLQTESKKQTALLERIASGVEKTADNTDGIESNELVAID